MEDKPLPYKPANLLTQNEEKFYNVLNSILKDKYRISLKTKLIDIATVPKNTPNYNTFIRKVIQKHVDFVIYEKENPSTTKLVIELNDSTHNKENRKTRDIEVDKVLKSAGIPILWIPVQKDYGFHEIKNKIETALGINQNIQSEVYINNSQIYETEKPERYNNNSIWNKSKKFLIEKGIPAIIAVVVFMIILPKIIPKILFQNTLKNIQQKTLPIPVQPQIPRENIIIASPKIKIKVRIAGKYISENKSYVMYERTDTKKQKNVTVEDFLKICECSATELYTDRLIEITEYP